jgi:hypothetical protein
LVSPTHSESTSDLEDPEGLTSGRELTFVPLAMATAPYVERGHVVSARKGRVPHVQKPGPCPGTRHGMGSVGRNLVVAQNMLVILVLEARLVPRLLLGQRHEQRLGLPLQFAQTCVQLDRDLFSLHRHDHGLLERELG